MELFECPYLGLPVELNDERMQHIIEQHAPLLPDHPEYIAGALLDPDIIRRKSPSDGSIQFCRWFYEQDKYTIVAVVGDPGSRYWIVTAYVTRRLPTGETLWQRK